MNIAAGRFKASCLTLMNQVAKTRRQITITKWGKPIARLVPIGPEPKRSIFGCMKGLLEIVDPNDDLFTAYDGPWDAQVH